MDRKLNITEEYLYLPVCVGEEEILVEVFAGKEDASKGAAASKYGGDLTDGSSAATKIFEFLVPVNQSGTEPYECDYYAEVPVREFLGRELTVRAASPEAFGLAIENGKKREKTERIGTKREPGKESRPVIHFAADAGWTNDPNGLIYADGVYHFYFQYNPFHTIWNNMSWGHAVSPDLLHWTQEDSVMFPDESGTMFSGCAISNERKLLGLPREALLFYYTAAGGNNGWSKGLEFTQKIAYSLDGGRTLVKKKEPCLGTIAEENRDPKVYWHEESQAYVMALFLKGNEYGIFRSKDLEHWEESDRFTLEEAWECPDFFRLYTADGEACWFFWTADGFYYPGEFDGYHFRTDGVRHHAYVTTIPYAAQSYFGTEGRVVMIPWLRFPNDGRLFTGAYGIPVELSCVKTETGFVLVQKPVRELMEQARRQPEQEKASGGSIQLQAKEAALIVKMTAEAGYTGHYVWNINGSRIEYVPESGKFMVDEEKYQVGCGHKEFFFLIDDRILEVFFDGGLRMGTFALKETAVSFETVCEGIAGCEVYEMK